MSGLTTENPSDFQIWRIERETDDEWPAHVHQCTDMEELHDYVASLNQNRGPGDPIMVAKTGPGPDARTIYPPKLA